MKNKTSTIIILVITFILAGIAIFTAIRLYQLRTQPVAPNVPSSKPRAQEASPAPVNTCSLSFTLATSTATATATATGTATATATSTSTSTSTATATATGTPNSCNGTCGSNTNCQGSYVCYQGFCRNPSCVAESDCVCNGTPGPTASQPSLPDSGTSWPSIFGVGLGILVIIGSLLLAL